MRSRLSKVILAADQVDLAVLHHAPQKWLCLGELLAEFSGSVHIRIDLASQRLLRWREGLHDLAKACLADHHQIDVASRTLVPARHGAVHERCPDLAAQRLAPGAPPNWSPNGLRWLRTPRAGSAGWHVDNRSRNLYGRRYRLAVTAYSAQEGRPLRTPLG